MNEKFSYSLEYLALINPSGIEAIIGLIVSISAIMLMRWVFLYGYGYSVVHTDQKELAKKKSTLSNLILMKDIQTELEKEIEKAMLKATFQG